MLDGRSAHLADGVQRALGRPAPRDFADYARNTPRRACGTPRRWRVTALTIVCAVGATAAGGALFTFSDFTMAGLKGLPPAQGIAAMQAINREAPSPLFMLLLFGTGAACLVMMVLAGIHLDEPGFTLRLVASGIYVASVVITTIASTSHATIDWIALIPRATRGRITGPPTSASGSP